MGYTTDFNGSLQLSRQLTEQEKEYINLFSDTRRMKRDVNKLWELYEGKHGNPFAKEQTPQAVYGREGEYFAMDDGDFGQSKDNSIIDYNTPPGQKTFGERRNVPFMDQYNERQQMIQEGQCQPGLWCQWIINEKNELEWNGSEKFYYYTEWLKYLIEHFFSKWGVILNGEITWEGEDSTDLGKIVVVDNIVTEKQGKIIYED